MVASRRWLWLVPGRRGRLLWLLAVIAAVLLLFFDDLTLSYELVAAREALSAGDAKGALASLERRADRGVRSPEWHYLLARAQRRCGRLADAERQLTEAAELGWNAQDICREQLLVKARSGKIKEVEAQLAELLDAGQTDEAAQEIYEAMAQSYWASYYVDDAFRCLGFWGEWQPENLLPRLLMADLQSRIENSNEAVAEYRKILERDPDHLEAQLKLAGLLLKKQEVAEAAEIFSRCAAQAPETPEALLGLAECRRRQGSSEECKDLLYDALQLDLSAIQAGEALSALGKMSQEDGEYGRAVSLLQTSVLADPNDASTHVSLAAALTAVGQEKLAATERQRARDTSDRHSRLVQTTRKTVAEPENADLRCEAGLILMEQGFWSEGADWIKTAIQIDPRHHGAHEALAKYYEHVGDLERAKLHRSAAARAENSAVPLKREEG